MMGNAFAREARYRAWCAVINNWVRYGEAGRRWFPLDSESMVVRHAEYLVLWSNWSCRRYLSVARRMQHVVKIFDKDQNRATARKFMRQDLQAMINMEQLLQEGGSFRMAEIVGGTLEFPVGDKAHPAILMSNVGG